MMPAKYRKAVGRNFEKGLDMLLISTGFTLLVGAIFSGFRASALLLTGTLVVTFVVLTVFSVITSK